MAAKNALDVGQQKRMIDTSARHPNSPNFTGPALAPPINDPHFHGPALVPVRPGLIGGAEVLTVNARELHAYLGNRDHFSTWIADRTDQFGFAQGADFETYSESSEKGGRPRIEYVTTLDMAKELSMVERTSKGKEARQYFIECERRALQAANDPTPVAQLPHDYITALEHLLVSKRSEQLAIEQRDHAVATKSQIGGRREASAMARASVAVREVNRLKSELGRGQTHATVTAVERATGQKSGSIDWRPLKKWSKEHGQASRSVPDARYGQVQAWPADAWGSVYSIDLSELFPAGE